MESTALHIRTVTAVMDTRTGQKLVSCEFRPTTWRDCIRPTGNFGLRSATKRAVQVELMVRFHVRHDEIRVRAFFADVPNLAFLLLLGRT